MRPAPTHLLIFALLLLGSGSAFGGLQKDRSVPAAAPASIESRLHNVGLLTLRVTNYGLLGGLPGENSSWRGDEYLFFSGLWVGAIGSDSAPHVTTATPAEFLPDPNPLWTLYESFEGIPGGRRLNNADPAVADDDGDGRLDEDFQNGLDDDGDGAIDEDFGAIGQQMFSAQYRDDTALSVGRPGHFPLNLLVKQRTLQWSVDGINEMVGVDLEIINDGSQVLQDIHLGFFNDFDIGPRDVPEYWLDDLVGWEQVQSEQENPFLPPPCNPVEYRIDAAFMWDASNNGGDVPGVFASAFLGHDTDPFGIRAPQEVGIHTLAWFTSLDGGPSTDADRYDLMALGTRPTANATLPNDYQFVISTGRFDRLYPGQSLHLAAALVVGDGEEGFRENLVRAQQVYDGYFIDADRDPNSGINGRERCLRVLNPGEVLVWVDPCDTLAAPVHWGETTCLWVDEDCDFCTGIDGKETRVRWVGTVTPPDPNTNLSPENRQGPGGVAIADPCQGEGGILLQWDNLPECLPDPHTGEIIFEGYRIWRADHYDGAGLGPVGDDFVQVAEFRQNPEGGPFDPNHLRNVTDRSVLPIGQDENGCSIYPIGRYAYTDTAAIGNMNGLFYTITTFGLTEVLDPVTGEFLVVERAGLPTAPMEHRLDCAVVPVRLSSFTAERVGREAILRWSVAEATDHTGFHVYRSRDGREPARITEQLLTGGPDYEFTDGDAPGGALKYRLQEVSRTGAVSWHGPVSVSAVPAAFTVSAPSRSPFAVRTTITYTLPDSRPVRISVFDLHGRRVRLLVNETQGPGEHAVSWSGRIGGRRAATGFYILRFTAGNETVSRKVLFTGR